MQTLDINSAGRNCLQPTAAATTTAARSRHAVQQPHQPNSGHHVSNVSRESALSRFVEERSDHTTRARTYAAQRDDAVIRECSWMSDRRSVRRPDPVRLRQNRQRRTASGSSSTARQSRGEDLITRPLQKKRALQGAQMLENSAKAFRQRYDESIAGQDGRTALEGRKKRGSFTPSICPTVCF